MELRELEKRVAHHRSTHVPMLQKWLCVTVLRTLRFTVEQGAGRNNTAGYELLIVEKD